MDHIQDSCIGNIGIEEGQVVTNTRMKQLYVLGDDANPLAQLLNGHIPNKGIAQSHPAFLRIIEPEEQARQGGLTTASADFSAQSDQTALRGRATFVDYDGRVYQAMGFSVDAQWASYEAAVTQTLRSFAQLTDQSALQAQPMRISIVTMDRSMTLRQFNERYPSSVDLEELAMVNQAEPYTAYAEGDLVKRIIGGINR